MVSEGDVTNLQVRNVFNLIEMPEEDFTELVGAFNTIDRIAKKQGSMHFVPTGYRASCGTDKLPRNMIVVLGWGARRI